MADTLNSTEERELLDAVKRAVDMVEKGTHPDDAIEKIAREGGFGPGKIKLAAHAYNNGRQLSQWQSSPSANILDKLASFTLCDPQAVISRIYGGPSPAEKAAAERVDPDYNFPPSWLERPIQEKRARAPLPLPSSPPLEPYQRDPVEDLHKAYGQVQRQKQAAEEASRLASAAEDTVRRKVANLVTYFKQASHARLPFETVEHAARAYYGNPSVPLLDMVYKQARLREKRASAQIPVLSQGVNLRAEPFTIIAEAIKAAEDCGRARHNAKVQGEKVATVKEAAFRPFSNAGGSKPSGQQSSALTLGAWDSRAADVFGVEKQGMGWTSEVAAIAAGDIAGQAIHHRVDPLMQQEHGGGGGGHDDELDDYPEQAEIASIKNRVALDSMLADPKNPLSKMPAQDVVKAYNDIVKMTPHLADDVPALQPLLEAKFQGKLGVPQLNQAATLDKKMGKEALEKQSLIDMAMAGAGAMAAKQLGSPGKTKDDLIEDAWMGLEDPNHHNELRKIKAHAMLNQLLTDTDDPISGHDPDRVLSAFNEIAAATPRVADNIHTLRPALRRKLEGNQEPFEAKELLDIEKGLAATKLPTPNTNILHDAPSKLLG